MKRWMFRIVLCLLFVSGGVVTTVAVAWGCSALCWRFANSWIDSDYGISSDTVREIPDYIREVHDSHSLYNDYLRTEGRSGYFTLGYDVYTIRSVGGTNWYLETTSLVVGWPLPSLWSYSTYYLDSVNIEPDSEPYFAQDSHGILFPSAEEESIWIPLLPILPGFLINTLFYAVIWFGLFFGIGLARKAIRRRRGRCEKCGYDLRGTPDSGCPECGWNRYKATNDE